jgi:ribosomal-protein-alanine N-acetyltransferase
LDRYTLVTDRLRLAPITFADSDRLALFHADARVMSLLKHGVLSRPQSDAMVADYEAEWSALGFGSWTVTERARDRFVGLGGLRVHDGPFGVLLRAAFTPEAQGKGYGPEFGRAALAFAFDVVGLDKVAALTRPENIPGQRGLEKFGMSRERNWTQEDGRELILYVARNPNGA